MDNHDPYHSLRHSHYRLFLFGSFCMNMANQAMGVAVGWHLYNKTGSAWPLAMIGLANYLPIFILSLPAGLASDRLERKKIMAAALGVMFCAALALAWLSVNDTPNWLWYVVLLISASAKAFMTPAAVSFYPTLLPENAVANAVPWSNATYQISAVAGPALGGALIAWLGVEAAFVFGAAGFLLYFFLLFFVHSLRPFEPGVTVQSMKELVTDGIRFIYSKKLILAPLTLDLFAVLFGGADALLPIFAKDILHVGPAGLGFLKAAPFAGAFVMGLFIAHRPMEKAGRSMLLAVAGFGASMIVFGLSRNYWLSLTALFLAGSLDCISVVVRQTLVQICTPDALRGRVQSVNYWFIGSSNELGQFESGVTAAAFGPVASVVGGGLLTIFVVLAVKRLWPELKNLGRLERP